MARPPAARGFTLAEKRALRFEQVSLYAVFLVALIAAAISFIALKAVGKDAGLGGASFLLPIAIDGFGIACSVGIVRSVAAGDRLRERRSEWAGLFGALGLSILGNVHHALKVGAADLPDYVKLSYAAAIPLIVAYGIHVYGKALSKGISAHVLAENPEELNFDLRHLGDETVAAQRAPVRVPPKPAARVPAQAAAQAPAQTAAQSARPASAPASSSTDDAEARARAVFDRLVSADPLNKPDAARVWRESGLAETGADGKPVKNVATVRGWVNGRGDKPGWWDEHQEQLGMGRPDPIEAQIAHERAEDVARTA